MGRTYSMSKLSAGEYVVPSNDGATLYRLTSYEDGRFHGLDRGPEVVTLWHVCEAPMPAHTALSVSEIRDLPWREVEIGFRSRKAALDSIFGAEEKRTGLAELLP